MTVSTPHALPAEKVAEALGTDLTQGLSQAEAEKRLAEYGPNELQEEPPPTFWQMLLAQFDNFVVILLIVAAIISGIVGVYTGEGLIDTFAILLIVVLNSVLGVVQEGRAEAALRALKKMSAPEAHVVRDGATKAIPNGAVVPGDIVILETGNYVPADVRLIEGFNLTIDEAALTGESVPAEKAPEAIVKEDASVGDRHNMAYMSSIVTYGRGRGAVTGTGMRTELGRIAEMIQSYEEEATPLQRRLDHLGKLLGWATLVICAIVFTVGIARLLSLHPIQGPIDVWLSSAFNEELTILDEIIELFMVAVSLAIAAVPEGLPAVVTIALALGMQRMIRRNALIRRLASVETLGSANVICSDKTGTLTTNEMTVTHVYVDGQLIKVAGRGYVPEGGFSLDGQGKVNPDSRPTLQLLARAAALCNDAHLVNENGAWKTVGDPTEGALLSVAAKAGLWFEDANKTWQRVAEVPFDSDRKRMTTIHRVPNPGGADLPLDGAEYVAFTKGAPELVLNLCSGIYAGGKVEPLSYQEGEQIQRISTELASKALRMLALAYRPMDSVPKRPKADEVERNLIFIGLVGMIDPARPEVKDAIARAKSAGIRTMMITGDYPETAVAIARELELLQAGGRTLTGAELDRMDAEELVRAVDDVDIFARVSPANKVQIVDALKARENVVAMTGDGVNDAPALKRANIGVAMGITGTDVSKQTADMVLTDDNYASIVNAVEEGRVIYANIRKFVFFLVSCNVGEIAIIFLSMLIGLPLPLLPIHLLWLNLVTDGAPALALGMEEAEPDIMKRKPRPSNEPILTRELWTLISVQAVVKTLSTLGAFVLTLGATGMPWNTWTTEQITLAQTVAFTTLALAELLRGFTARSERYNIWQIGFFTNRWTLIAVTVSFVLMMAVVYLPFLRPIFNTAPLGLLEWEYMIPLILLPALAEEIAKFVLRRLDRRGDSGASEAPAAA
ncbi:MAG: cation-translocating P-type ATPase [Anaerolineae bacterium]|nr:cation-translocating P-type ATPase [Anaerolineae bacterium]